MTLINIEHLSQRRTPSRLDCRLLYNSWRLSTTKRPRSSVFVAAAAAAAIVFKVIRVASGCYIHGADIGYCEPTLYTDSDFREANTPFCSSFIKYSACVPKYDPLSPSRDFPDGRWFNNTMTAKDSWVQQYFETVVAYRLQIEGEKDLQKQGIDEYGNKGSPVPRFTDNRNCEKAYKAYMCYINFPRCDDGGNSLVTCRSACENMMVACENQKDLWRCGDSKYFNGYEAEEPEIDGNGDPVYMRDFFPGQPFEDVSFTRGKADIVCTPSIKGGAQSRLGPPGLGRIGMVALFVAIASLLLAF